MLTASSDDADIFEALKSGASGYLSKDLEADRFLELLDGIRRGAASALTYPWPARCG
jgi:DNA-binding NarL/FixJ family response regulator